MKKLLILLLCSTLFHSGPVFGWGREGHETIAKIAERNLTKRAKKRIEKYLGGHSIVYYAKWMDEYRKTPEYAYTDGWHTAPVDARLHYSDELLNPKRGNAIYGLESAIRILENYREQSDSTVAVNLKYVIHLVGDMHCPTHVKYPVIKGFNTAMQFLIISPNQEEIVRRIHTEMDRGCTRLEATGTYEGRKNGALLCVVPRMEASRLKKIVSECDAHAFVTVCDVHEALGEGFSYRHIS